MRNYRENKGRGFNNRHSSDRPTAMFDAVCSNCGSQCQVPFRPTGSKPVLCSRCFENSRGNDRGSSYNDRGSSRPSYGDRQEFPRQMHDAVCEKCGQNCQIPFQPRNGRPVYCNNCFRNSDGDDSRRPAPERSAPQNNAQLDAISAKLDQIIALLTPAAPQKAAKAAKEAAEVITIVEPEKKEKKKAAKKTTKKATK